MSLAQLGRCLSGLLQQSQTNAALGCVLRNLHTSCVLEGKQKFIKLGIDINKYTMRPLPLHKSGGRGHDGRVQTNHIGGGHKQRYRMIDFKRTGPTEGPPLEERVTQIRYDPCRTADIAVVAGGTKKRYILASETMAVGTVIKTSGKITRIAVRGQEGDAFPVGSLPVGTLVHNLERFAGKGGMVARAAGTSAQLLRKLGDTCVLRMPSKREVVVSSNCMATIGRVSNIHHNKSKMGSAGRARWFGIRPCSGKQHKKIGTHGRKVRPVRKAVVHNHPGRQKPAICRFTV